MHLLVRSVLHMDFWPAPWRAKDCRVIDGHGDAVVDFLPQSTRSKALSPFPGLDSAEADPVVESYASMASALPSLWDIAVKVSINAMHPFDGGLAVRALLIKSFGLQDGQNGPEFQDSTFIDRMIVCHGPWRAEGRVIIDARGRSVAGVHSATLREMLPGVPRTMFEELVPLAEKSISALVSQLPVVVDHAKPILAEMRKSSPDINVLGHHFGRIDHLLTQHCAHRQMECSHAHPDQLEEQTPRCA